MDHEIKIKLKGNHAVPSPSKVLMKRNDTVKYISDPPGLAFKVVFEGDPFSELALIITDSEVRTVKRPGKFFSKCFITKPDGTTVGWHPNEKPQSGGEHDVKP